MQTRIAREEGKLVIANSQDCTAILEDATARRNEGLHGSSEMRHAANFPMVLVQKYMNEHGIDFREFMTDKKHVKAMLSDPDLAGFRIWEGKV
ncbi:MAG: hypothetical protein KGL39_36685 [Patescibacteria group bacterium]|nr:hypothetical protein [Patescibacteria group bacterium]